MNKNSMLLTAIAVMFTIASFAQTKVNVPGIVKEAFAKKFPEAKKVTWETEKGNYEANWGGKSGEDNSVLYTPSGKFLEAGKAIGVNQLPPTAVNYIKNHYKGASITESMQVTDANGKVTYQAEVNGKDIVFDEHGNFVK